VSVTKDATLSSKKKQAKLVVVSSTKHGMLEKQAIVAFVHINSSTGSDDLVFLWYK
jgi:hypothetical protein